MCLLLVGFEFSRISQQLTLMNEANGGEFEANWMVESQKSEGKEEKSVFWSENRFGYALLGLRSHEWTRMDTNWLFNVFVFLPSVFL